MTQRRRADPEQRVAPPGFGRVGTRALEVAENVVYAGIALLLVVTGLLLLALAGRTTWDVVTGFTTTPVIELLDVLLLVFIVVELLFAVRTTVERRELVAEPFLVIGVIASIKEIVVLSVEAADAVGRGSQFDDRLTEIGVLGVLVLLLAVAAWLLRRKEREPDEGEGAEREPVGRS
ncbi:phosphate-starvation-inducible PsiE family protein [Geodermatophilus sp. SYSU D00758]